VSEQRDLMAGRYRLQHRIGSGGMGHVWLAWDERLNRAVAIKQLRTLSDLPPAEAAVAHQRAMREARITARLDHPNAVPVFDVVDHEGQPCLVMQYVPSRSLHEILRSEGTLAPIRVAKVGGEVAAALAAAHAARIVHRDVKPGNILITDDGTALITDFGISRAFGDASLTSTGMLTGTPAYLAPEVARGASATPASDVFSLGATLYAAVEGTPPFGAGDNPMALLHKVASGQIDPPRLAGALSDVLLTMLDADPDRRPTMQQASQVLARLASGAPLEVRERVGSTKVLPVAAAAGLAEGLQAQGGHTVELPADPPPPVSGPVSRPASGPVSAPVAAPLAAPLASPVDEPFGEPVDEPPAASEGEPAVAPPARPGDLVDPQRRRRRRAGVLAAAVALLILAVWGVLRANDPGGAAAPAPRVSPTGSPAGSPTGSPTGTSATSTTPAPRATSTRPSASPSASPTSAAPKVTSAPATTSPVPAPSTTASPPAQSGSGAVTASELSTAVKDYYGLLPANTDAGWARLTPRYQRTTATSRSYYERFWSAIKDVQLSQVSGKAPSSVVATVRYDYVDGRTYIERTAYSLVRQDGQLKIDRSSVLSSKQV
jgi:eukaryotic-like serine/threonine-protein kinase